MTTSEAQTRAQQTLEKIEKMFANHDRLRNHVGSVAIAIEASQIVLTGQLPDAQLVDELVPTIRQAGVLCRVDNRVRQAA